MSSTCQLPTAAKAIIAVCVASALLALGGCNQSRNLTPPTGGGTAGLDGCTACHGDANRAEASVLLQAAPPRTVSGKPAGAHAAHLHDNAFAAKLECAECHGTPPASTSHSNGVVDFAFGPRATNQGAFVASYANATCAVYCHGATLATAGGTDRTPSWTGGARSCTSCHGAPPPAPHPQGVTLTDCAGCHPGTVNPNGTINVAGGLHINGAIDVNQAHPAGWVARTVHGYAANANLAQCRQCHGADLNGGNVGVSCNACHASNGHAGWQTECTFCHGTPGRLPAVIAAAPPVGPQGETATTDAAVGAHQAHLVGSAIASPVACTDCHATLPTDLTHVNGTAAVEFGAGATRGGATPVWNGNNCSASYCHGGTLNAGGTNHAPVWTGGAAQAACGTCHGVPPPPPHSTSTDCAGCHGAGYSTTTVNAATHIDGTVTLLNLSCTSCHGDATRLPASIAAAPPVGTKGETLPTARAVGAHQKHLVSTLATSLACSDCHGTLPTSTSHSNGVVNLAFGSRATAGGATATFNGTTVTCANYCHGGGSLATAGGTLKTPLWTGGAAQAACGTCHGIPPPAPHTTNTDCASCHGAGYSTTTVNAATHIDGLVTLLNLTCTSCHGDPARLPASLAPAPPVGTKGETLTTARAVGAHQKHLVSTLGPAVACSECHGTVPTSTAHSNGVVNLAFGGRAIQGGAAATFNGTTVTCANYCHGGGSLATAGGTNKTPLWTGGAAQAACGTCHGVPPPAPHTTNTACAGCHGAGYSTTTVNAATHLDGTVTLLALTCTSCHGTAGGTATAASPLLAAPPLGTKGETATTTRAVGAHQKHLAGGAIGNPVACGQCHANVGTNTTAHANGTVDLAWGTLATGNGSTAPSFNGTTLSCANYCHGGTLTAGGGSNRAPVWTSGPAQAACGTCHGAPPPPPHSTNTACAGCHGAGYSATTVNLATHIDGTVQVLNLTCTSCHGSAGGTATAASPLLAAPPTGTKGETATTTRAVGAHQKHLVAGTLRNAIACTECHANVGTYTTGHTNGVVNLDWGNLAKNGNIPTFNGTTLTCANYCHGVTLTSAGGTNKAPAWTGGATQAACGTCHGAPPPPPHTVSTSCGNCHGAGYSATTVNLATHIDGTLQLLSLSCTSCHGKSGQAATAASPLNAAPPTDTAGNATGTKVGAHQKHLLGGTFGNAIACTACHALVGTYTIDHQNGVADVGFTGGQNANLRKGTYSVAGNSCSATWCHGAVISPAGGTSGGTLTTPLWTSTVTACTACHATALGSLTNRHPTHSGRATCANCHGAAYGTGTTVDKATHMDGLKTIFITATGTGIRSYNTATRSCSPSCHGTQTW